MIWGVIHVSLYFVLRLVFPHSPLLRSSRNSWPWCLSVTRPFLSTLTTRSPTRLHPQVSQTSPDTLKRQMFTLGSHWEPLSIHNPSSSDSESVEFYLVFFFFFTFTKEITTLFSQDALNESKMIVKKCLEEKNPFLFIKTTITGINYLKIY